jgi:integrase
MALQTNKLSARSAATVTKPGRHSDGGGLYLNVTESGARSWVFLWKAAGRRREMGLGPLRDVPLAKARDLAAECRRLIREGHDPLATRDAGKPATMSFGEAADELVASMAPSWRNEKHRAQWVSTLREYCAPIRGKGVQEIDTADVLRILQPIWQTKSETASRLRGRIERVLDFAKARGVRSGENPARWRGHLDAILPKRHRLTRGHHAAMPFEDVPGFVARLRRSSGMGPRALEFAILTAARSGEVLGARWDEVDLAAKIWTVPARRMKAGRVHRVPLCERALALLAEMETVRTNDLIFPGARGKQLSVMTMAMVLRRAKVEVTVHGFRSAFRDWAGELTHFPREVAEAALAHTVGDATERAYRRGDALGKRRELMNAWARYCDPSFADNVVPIASAAR